MSDFHRVCKTIDIPDPGKATFEVEDRFVVVFHLDGQFYALDDCCTHDGGPLGEGIIDCFHIICPRHAPGSTFAPARRCRCPPCDPPRRMR